MDNFKGELLYLLLKFEDIELKEKQFQFVPESDGFHRSRTLWEGQEGVEEYWETVNYFLSIVYQDNY